MKNLIENLLSQIANKKGLATSRGEAKEKGFDSYVWIDHASVYGGYRMISVNLVSGCHNGIFGKSSACNRMTKKEFICYLEGLRDFICYNDIK
jgi:hypothetical protein